MKKIILIAFILFTFATPVYAQQTDEQVNLLIQLISTLQELVVTLTGQLEIQIQLLTQAATPIIPLGAAAYIPPPVVEPAAPIIEIAATPTPIIIDTYTLDVVTEVVDPYRAIGSDFQTFRYFLGIKILKNDKPYNGTDNSLVVSDEAGEILKSYRPRLTGENIPFVYVPKIPGDHTLLIEWGDLSTTYYIDG